MFGRISVMQNYQSTIKVVGGHLRQQFDKLLLAESPRPKIQPVTIKTKMPLFQIQYFVKQAIEKKMNVKIQMIPLTNAGQVENAKGVLKIIAPNKIMLKSNNSLRYVVSYDQIRFIEQA